jgi:hypothetical protein
MLTTKGSDDDESSTAAWFVNKRVKLMAAII